MLNFRDLTPQDFLTHYWQKKPLVLRSAIPNFIPPLSPDELAGLAMEEDLESRIIIQTPGQPVEWTLKRGPFSEKEFEQLPLSHWTLLVQGVDRVVPEVAALLDHFNCLPQWRFDDVMISYATNHGGVGPHYDHYDVFLYQAQGRRKWYLTTKDCVDSNYQENLELRIMKTFDTEMELTLEAGDLLYLPPHVGHHGVSLSEDCMTYSFGYRSYQTQELWDSLGEYMAARNHPATYYQDPNWSGLNNSAEIPDNAWQQAKKTLQTLLDDEQLLKSWFGSFATTLDRHAESLLPVISETGNAAEFVQFKQTLQQTKGFIRNPLCRFAYVMSDTPPDIVLYVNGCVWETTHVDQDLILTIAEQREIVQKTLTPWITLEANQHFLYELWQLQWLEFME